MKRFCSWKWQQTLEYCLHHRDLERAKLVHGLMLSRGIHPPIVSANRFLDMLSEAGEIDQAVKVFDKMRQRDEYSWNTMIKGYARSRLLAEARRLFEQAPARVPITWSSLISGYALNGCEDEALELFGRMQSEGLKPNEYTFGSVLRACAVRPRLSCGQQVHAHVLKTGFHSNVFVVTGLVDMYAKCRRVHEATNLFTIMPERNTVLWTAMVSGLSQNGEGRKAMEIFREMHRSGARPNQFTFPSVLTACASISDIDFGTQIHNHIIQTGFGPNVFVESALVDMYSKCGDLSSAQLVLDNMIVADEVSWNSMIGGCVRHGLQARALCIFKRMHETAMRIDDFTYPSVLNSFASLNELKHGQSVHSMIVKTGFGTHKHVGNALVDMYAKCGSLGYASSVFITMPEPDVISWTSLITGYAHHGFHEDALRLFCDMRDAGIYTDEFALASALSACAGLTVLEVGRQIHVIFIKSGFGSSLSIENSLVTMYAKCGCIMDAHTVFDLMPDRDVVSWTALIVGHAQNGRGNVSLELYEKMLRSGTKPDFITFVGVLFACSHAGLVEDGRYYFESMSKIHGISPSTEHYACMIDLLGRAGQIDAAEELLNEMPIKPDATVWKALLSACRVHGKIELGEMAACNLLALEPQNAVPYILLSHMYSSAGKWEDAAKIRRLMKSRGVTKEPGCSWIEMNNTVHAFLAEDRGHPRMAEIYSKIDLVMSLIKEAGYVPDRACALHDVDEEGKEIGLAYHSEKLAVAFGLLAVPPGCPIRVVKNLRVCGDCHSAIKYISKVFSRKIIVRDSNCYHHFSEGACSCRDYW
ncbi:putative pentatricopeptide repeat-containing protein [Nymphaea thermarum]|nr:putative pentatricopeptide repeat-containing protein [Nymphaea thermarum]